MKTLTHRVCAVTGAATSIGLAIAEAYARAGAAVALIDKNETEVLAQAERLRRAGHSVQGYGLDVTVQDQVFATFQKIRAAQGQVFALVNNAGIVDQRPFTEITPAQMDAMMRVNVHGSLFCIQAVAADMQAAQDGRIINFSSKSGKTGSPLMAHYSAAKGAIIALTHAIAMELAPFEITVNCLCPGIVENTGVWNSVSRGYIENLNLPREKVVEQFTAKIPLKRLARVEDIVEFVLFLTSSGAYCTGQAFNISGGREVH